jgi:branched-chain amino acid transport system ATP-binding protein
MLDVLDLHTYYGDSHVLQGVTMHVEKGTVTAVLGRNGVGKTTLCRSLVGLTPARTGRIVFNGTEIARLPAHRICAMRISLVPQGRRIFPSLTVEENLAIASRPAPPATTGSNSQVVPRPAQLPGTREASLIRAPGESWDIQNVYAAFPRLSERRSHRGNELSGGEQQMLAIARALVANPALLVMDEPTEGLAPMLVEEVRKLIRRLKDEGTSILLVEQNAAFAVKTADYVHVMSKGQIVHSSEPAALWANQDIKTQFLGVPRAPSTPSPTQHP